MLEERKGYAKIKVTSPLFSLGLCRHFYVIRNALLSRVELLLNFSNKKTNSSVKASPCAWNSSENRVIKKPLCYWDFGI